MKRVEKITNIRAFAIIMVVLGHSIILYSSDWGLYESIYSVPWLDRIKRLINYIQMPLFFSISGFLFSISKLKPFGKFVFAKAKRLIIPYVVIGLCYLIPVRLAVGYRFYMNRGYLQLVWDCIIFGNDNGHLWYLPCLFLCFAIAYMLFWIVRKSVRSKEIEVVITLAVAILFYMMRNNVHGTYLVNFSTYFVWFCVGGMQAYLHGLTRKKHHVISALFIIMLLCVSQINSMQTFSVSGILLMLIYQLIPVKDNTITRLVSEYSYGLYLFHSPLIYITFSMFADAHPIFVVFINFVVFGGTAWGLTVLVRRCRLGWVIGEK